MSLEGKANLIAVLDVSLSVQVEAGFVSGFSSPTMNQ
jgi:hypothetical protein